VVGSAYGGNGLMELGSGCVTGIVGPGLREILPRDSSLFFYRVDILFKSLIKKSAL